jgi:transcription elongation GreA/GreB family factor
MSRAFVKEQDSDLPEVLPDRPVSEHPNDVTQEGLARIESSLEQAEEALANARASDAAAGVASATRDIRYWRARRATARVVPSLPDVTQVRFGHWVTILRDDGRKQTFRIVGEDEADPKQGTISHVSPLARAMLGRAIGDTVAAGATQAEIVRINERP